MEKTSLIVGIVVIVVVIAAAAYLGTQPAAPPTTTPTTAAPTAATATATATTTEIIPVEKLKVALVIDAPTITSHSWYIAQYDGLLVAQEKYDFELEYTEGAAVAEGERVGRSYADRGFDVLFYGSWYPDSIKAIAEDFQDVVVMGAGGGTELHVIYPPPEQVPPNVGHYDSYLHEAAYLCGYLAGKMTETDSLGMVGQYPVANANRYYNGFVQGAKDANPDVEINMTWIFSWYDPATAKEGAIALIEGGADFIFSDASGAWEGAIDKGVYYMNGQLEHPATTVAPEVTIASINWILTKQFDEVISSVIDGTFQAKEYFLGMADGGSEFRLHLPDEVPSDILSEVIELEDRIINGELVIDPVIIDPIDYWRLS